MSLSEIHRFVNDVENNSALRDRFRASNAADLDARIAAVRSAGYEIEKSDLEALNGTMSDAELDGIAGGGLHLGDKIKHGFQKGWNAIWN